MTHFRLHLYPNMPHNFKDYCRLRVQKFLFSAIVRVLIISPGDLLENKTTTNKLLVIYLDSVIQQYCWVCNKTHYLPHFNFWDVQRPRMHDHACMICVFYFIFSSGLAEISCEKRRKSYYLTSILLTFDLFLCCFMFKI